MSELNRWGLGLMLMLLVFIGTVIADMDPWVTFGFGVIAFGFGVIAMVGYVLFVHEKKK